MEPYKLSTYRKMVRLIKNKYFGFGIFLVGLLIFFFVNNSYKSMGSIINYNPKEAITSLYVRVDGIDERNTYEITDKFVVEELIKNLSDIKLKWSGSYSSIVPLDYDKPIVIVYNGSTEMFSITSKGEVYIQNKRYLTKDYQGKQIYDEFMSINHEAITD